MEKNERFFFILILLLAFFLRLFRVLRPDVIANDGVLYVETARLLASGQFAEIKETAFFNLYPVFIVLFYELTGDWEISGRLVSAIFGTLSIIPLCLLGRKLINEKISLVFALFYSISPHVVEYSSDILREPVFWFLFFFSLYFGAKGFMERKWVLVCLSSFFSLLSTLTRIEGVVSPAIIISWAIYLTAKNEFKKESIVRFLSMYTVSLVLLVIGFLFLLKLFTSAWELGPLAFKIQQMFLDERRSPISVEKELTSVGSFSPFAKSFIDLSLRHKYVSYASELIYKSIKSMGAVFFVLLVIALIKDRRSFGDGKCFFIFWIIVTAIASYAYIFWNHYLSTRHGLLLGIPAFIWSSKGFFEVLSILKSRTISRKKGSISFVSLTAFMIILLVILTIPFSLKAHRVDKLELREAGLHLRDNGFKEKKIATFSHLSRVVFYAQARPVYINEAKHPATLKEDMQKKGVHFVLLDRELKEILEKTVSLNHVGFEKIHIPQFERLKNYSFFLYRLNSDTEEE